MSDEDAGFKTSVYIKDATVGKEIVIELKGQETTKELLQRAHGLLADIKKDKGVYSSK